MFIFCSISLLIFIFNLIKPIDDMTNLDSVLKKQRHYFADKGPSSQSCDFSRSHVQMWQLVHKEGWSLDCREIRPVSHKGDQPWIFIERTVAKAVTPVLWPSDVKSQLIGKDPGAGKDWRQRRWEQQRMR